MDKAYKQMMIAELCEVWGEAETGLVMFGKYNSDELAHAESVSEEMVKAGLSQVTVDSIRARMNKDAKDTLAEFPHLAIN